MKFFSIVGNSFGCSASGERLVSAARDGDFQEAKALLDYNPRLARYSTFGVRNSPLHYSAAQGHHEIVTLLVESGVDINLRNYRGQTALMQACQYGHWEVVQILILFKANIHRADYLNGGTALHLAALNGHTRCIRLLLADYIPSETNFWNLIKNMQKKEDSVSNFVVSKLSDIINRPADGGITALHMASLNGHAESVQLLLDLGASVSETSVEDGTTIDLVGAGSTPLHYAACGGNAQCCQLLIARGASISAENDNGWTPLMVAKSWQKIGLDAILSTRKQGLQTLPSPYLSIPLMSIVQIARECGWRDIDSLSSCQDPCVVCLERRCTVAVEGCGHEFCTHCALYLCSTHCTSAVAKGPPGSITCPLCRYGIVSFQKLPWTTALPTEITRSTSLSLSFCACTGEVPESSSVTAPLCTQISTPSSSFRGMNCQKFPSMKITSSLCMCVSDSNPPVIPCTVNRNLRNHLAKCSRPALRRSASNAENRRSSSASPSSWFCSLNPYVATGSGC